MTSLFILFTGTGRKQQVANSARLAFWAVAGRDTLRESFCCAGVEQRLDSKSLSLKQASLVFVYALGTRGGAICGVATKKNRNRLLVQASPQNPRSRRKLQRLHRKHNRQIGRQSQWLTSRCIRQQRRVAPRRGWAQVCT